MENTAAGNGIFQDFFYEVPPIRIREPLAETLGAFKKQDAVVEYGFVDLVKMAGHACPTIAGSFLICQAALKALYPDDTPVRGEVEVTVFGEVDEGVYGVIGQALSLITGAAPLSGFRGLGHKFKRKDLLVFEMHKIDSEASCFKFRRVDEDRSVLVKFYPKRLPLPAESGRRLFELMEKVIWEAATEAEQGEFQELWIGRVRDMLLKRENINRWLIVEEED